MITADAEAVCFSVKSFVAAIIAHYISLRIGFAQPVWAVTRAPLAPTLIGPTKLRSNVLHGFGQLHFFPSRLPMSG
jgi:hypothetical protein